MFKPNTFIKWSSEENGKKFSYIGRVLKCTDDFIIFIDIIGSEYGVPLNDGSFVEATRPSNWTETLQATPTGVDMRPTPAPRRRAPSGESKKDKAQVIFNRIGDNKQQVIDALISELNMTPAGAQTYYYNCRRAS